MATSSAAETSLADNPCLRCGACCASFRVSFYWAEAADAPGGTVPVDLTEAVTPHLRCMRGTSNRAPQCIALRGEVGEQVNCVIYAQRSSTCREFDAWLADGRPDPRCQEARQRWRLPALGIRPGTAESGPAE